MRKERRCAERSDAQGEDTFEERRPAKRGCVKRKEACSEKRRTEKVTANRAQKEPGYDEPEQQHEVKLEGRGRGEEEREQNRQEDSEGQGRGENSSSAIVKAPSLSPSGGKTVADGSICEAILSSILSLGHGKTFPLPSEAGDAIEFEDNRHSARRGSQGTSSASADADRTFEGNLCEPEYPSDAWLAKLSKASYECEAVPSSVEDRGCD